MIERRYYVTILGFLLILSSGIFFILLDKKHSRAMNATPVNNNDIFVRELVEKFSYIKERLLAFKEIFTSFKKNIIPIYYDTAESLTFSTTFNDSVDFSFGYAGHGALAQGFKGTQARIIIKDVSDTWQHALRQALVELNLAEIVNVNPAQEWLLKFLLLVKDRIVNKRITFPEYIMESTLLFARLIFTPGFDSFDKVIQSLSPLLASIFNSISIKNKKCADICNAYYVMIHGAMQRRFPKKMIAGKLVDDPTYVPNGSPINEAQAQGIIISLFIRSFLFYAELCDMYDKTLEGKIGRENLAKATSLDERVQMRRDYNAKLPSYNELRIFILTECVRIIARVQNEAYKNTIVHILNPLLEMIGIPTDIFLSDLNSTQVASEPPVPNIVEPEFSTIEFNDFDPDTF